MINHGYYRYGLKLGGGLLTTYTWVIRQQNRKFGEWGASQRSPLTGNNWFRGEITTKMGERNRKPDQLIPTQIFFYESPKGPKWHQVEIETTSLYGTYPIIYVLPPSEFVKLGATITSESDDVRVIHRR